VCAIKINSEALTAQRKVMPMKLLADDTPLPTATDFRQRSYTSRLRAKGVTVIIATTLAIGIASQGVRAEAASHAEDASHSEAQGASQWIGKRLSDVKAKLGQPTTVQPLQETTGALIIYAQPGERHYAFETGPSGKIVTATVIH
jgi:hypothetical protein